MPTPPQGFKVLAAGLNSLESVFIGDLGQKASENFWSFSKDACRSSSSACTDFDKSDPPSSLPMGLGSKPEPPHELKVWDAFAQSPAENSELAVQP